jgi:hypothetical protein
MRRIMFLDPESISEVKFAAGGILVPFRGRYLVNIGKNISNWPRLLR